MTTQQQGQQLAPRANGQIATFKQKVENVRDLLKRHEAQIKLALPRGMRPERMARIVLTTITQTPKLLDCNPQTLIRCVLQAAALGLEPDGLLGQAYLIPFENRKKGTIECQLIPGYKGLLKLSRNSGEIASIEAAVVRKGDVFQYSKGTDSFLKHVPAEPVTVEKDGVAVPAEGWAPGVVTHVYAVARLKDGTRQFEVMATWEVNEIRDNSQGYKTALRFKSDSPWISHYPEMAKKTVLRRLCKMLPASVELQTAVTLDETADAGVEQPIGDVIDIDSVESPGQAEAASKLDQLADAAEKKKRFDAEGNLVVEEPGADG